MDSISNPTQPPFASANTGNTTPNIAQFHPFSIPSQGGTWIPVIRYVYVNGQLYTSTPVPGANYASDLVGCPTNVTVSNLICTTPSVGQPGYNNNAAYPQYSHKFSYNSTTSLPSDATKTLGFTLNATTNYFPFLFLGYTASDRIKISYVSGNTVTLLRDVAVGTDIPDRKSTRPNSSH